jgi:hypothetical protein
MTKKNTPAGVAGNVRHEYVPLRQWTACSYGVNGRPVSSLSADQRGTGSPSTTHVENKNLGYDQIPSSAFSAIDKRRCQDATPVRDRAFTKVRE